MRPLRILHITYDHFPYDVLVRRVCNAAVDGGVQVDVMCSRRPDEAPRETYRSVEIHRLPIRRPAHKPLPLQLLHWGYFTLQAGIGATWMHLRRRYDVVHVHNMPDFLVFSALGPKLLGAKVILHVQDVSPELMTVKATGRKRRLLHALAVAQERLSTAFADSVVTVGWPFERLLLQRGVRPDKLTIILNSADPEIFPERRRIPPRTTPPTRENPLTVMYHGTQAYRSGLDTAIRALALALPRAPHLRLELMGSGEAIPSLKRLAQELGIADHVGFSPSAAKAEQIVDFVVRGDIGIISYPADGFMDLLLPTKAYEWAWLSKPMIASDTPAMRSMFSPGAISLCAPSDPAAFAEAMVDLYDHPEKRVQMADRALADYQAYRWEAMGTRYVELLGQLAGRTPAPIAAGQPAAQRGR